MRVLVLTLFLVLAGRLAAPSEATAQYHRLTDAIVVGGTLASAGSGSERFAGGPEIGGLIEVPIGDAYRLRGEAAAGVWHFNGVSLRRRPGQPDAPLPVHRQRAAQPRSAQPAPAPRRRTRAAAPASICIGSRQRPNGGAWGIHGLAGAEYLLPTTRSRWIVGGEVQLHALGQPKSPGDVTVDPDARRPRRRA